MESHMIFFIFKRQRKFLSMIKKIAIPKCALHNPI